MPDQASHLHIITTSHTANWLWPWTPGSNPAMLANSLARSVRDSCLEFVSWQNQLMPNISPTSMLVCCSSSLLWPSSRSTWWLWGTSYYSLLSRLMRTWNQPTLHCGPLWRAWSGSATHAEHQPNIWDHQGGLDCSQYSDDIDCINSISSVLNYLNWRRATAWLWSQYWFWDFCNCSSSQHGSIDQPHQKVHLWLWNRQLQPQ